MDSLLERGEWAGSHGFLATLFGRCAICVAAHRSAPHPVIGSAPRPPCRPRPPDSGCHGRSGDRERGSVQAEAQQAIRGAVDGDIVPPLCMTYIVDWNVGVLAPEEGDGVEGSVEPEHVQRRDLSLALGDNPMLDASELARVRVRPARDVARGEDAGALVSSLASTATPRS